MNPEDKLNPLVQKGQSAVDKAADTTKDAIRSTQSAANQAMDRASDKLDQAQGQVAPALDKISDTANAAMVKVREAWNDTSAQLREQAQKASELATGYAKDEPMKAMLIAAATGAVLMGLLSMMTRSRD